MRVAFVIERYWPLMTAAGWVLDPVLRYLRGQGHDVFVLTAQVDRLWPEAVTVRDTLLYRFGHDAWNLFSRVSLGQRIAKWLRENQDRWDAVVVWEPLEGVEQIAQVAGSLERPSIGVFCEGGADSKLEEWLSTACSSRSAGHGGERSRRPGYSHWVIPTAGGVAALRERLPAAQVGCWSLGVPDLAGPSDQERRRLRGALTCGQDQLARDREQPLIVYYGHGLVGPDSRWLWQLLCRLVERRPGVTVWILGTGPAWPGLWRTAMEAGLEDRVLFPGDFGDLADVWRAADLILFPQMQRWLSYPWLLSVACQTPALVSPTPGVVDLIQQVAGDGWRRDLRWSNVLPRNLDIWISAAERLLEPCEQVRHDLPWQRAVLSATVGQVETLRAFEQTLIQWVGE